MASHPTPAGAAAPAWPDDGLEFLGACPICGSVDRDWLLRGLRDKVFGCAPGEWNLAGCRRCGAGYLDPRPSPAAVGLAYARYYTHTAAPALDRAPKSAWRRRRLAQRNAYLNARYGYRLEPAAARPPARVSTDRRQRWDKLVGYLPFPGPGARLLDLGCGNGVFLLHLRAAGWDAAGLEPDPAAAAAAVAAGLDVRTGLLEDDTFPEATFDAVTMSHVVEHLHHPVEALRRCRRILKPGGRIYVATPNLASAGRRLYGADWRDLDPPRHLVLFTPESLKLAFQKAGLEPEAAPLRLSAGDTLPASDLIRRFPDPAQRPRRLSWAARWRVARLARRADAETRRHPERTEELILLGCRPAAG